MLFSGHRTPLKLSSATVQSTSNGYRTPPLLFLPRSPHPLPAVSAPLQDAPNHLQSKTKTSLQMSLDSLSSAGNLTTELNDESDFTAVSSPDGYLSICGFGSLLSEKSARSTFPNLCNFRIGVLQGFRRVFAHVAPIFFERGIANRATRVREVSSLSVEPCDGEMLIVSVFEIEISEVPAFIEREHEFRFLAVIPENLDGTPYSSPAVICARYSDDEYFRIRCKGSKEIFFQRYGRYDIQKIWQDDILPCRVYLRHCVLAAKNLGQAAYDNFLDHTYLADRKTTIRQYLASAGSGIMEEEPPEALKSRYGG